MNFFLTNQGTNLWVELEITDFHHLASFIAIPQPPDFNNKAMIYFKPLCKLKTANYQYVELHVHACLSIYVHRSLHIVCTNNLIICNDCL